jgi:hypothetical protein
MLIFSPRRNPLKPPLRHRHSLLIGTEEDVDPALVARGKHVHALLRLPPTTRVEEEIELTIVLPGQGYEHWDACAQAVMHSGDRKWSLGRWEIFVEYPKLRKVPGRGRYERTHGLQRRHAECRELLMLLGQALAECGNVGLRPGRQCLC